jgi:hypothetical protein
MPAPTAAKGAFPYPHRTVADLDRDQRPFNSRLTGPVQKRCHSCGDWVTRAEAAFCPVRLCLMRRVA